MSDAEGEVQTRLMDQEILKYDVFWTIAKLNALVAGVSKRESDMSTLVATRLGTIIGGGPAVIDQSEVWRLLFVLNRGGILCNEDPWSNMSDIVEIPTDANLLSIEVLETPVEVPDVSLLSIEVLESPAEVPDVSLISTDVLETPVEILVDVPEPLVEIHVETPLVVAGDQSALSLMHSSYEEDQAQFDAEISAMLSSVE
jgi:hypothetical protein